MFFLLHPVRWYMISVCPIIGGVHFDHLSKVLSAGLSTVKLLIFPLLIIPATVLVLSPINLFLYTCIVQPLSICGYWKLDTSFILYKLHAPSLAHVSINLEFPFQTWMKAGFGEKALICENQPSLFLLYSMT